MFVIKLFDIVLFGKIKILNFLKYIKMDVIYCMSKLDEECWWGMLLKFEFLILWCIFG